MKIVQDDDQQQIASAAESLSKDLLTQLSSLNIGDAVLVGQWENLPSIVHVDEVKGKAIGSDLDAVAEWSESTKYKEIAAESTQGLIQEDCKITMRNHVLFFAKCNKKILLHSKSSINLENNAFYHGDCFREDLKRGKIHN